MKKQTTLIFSLIILFTVVSCVKASNTTKRKSNMTSNGSTNGSGNGSGNGFTDNGNQDDDDDDNNSNVSDCSDGIRRENASRCYYTLPTLTFSGSGLPGAAQYWSSAYNLGTTYSTNIFRTDMNFAVRIKPKIAQDSTSFQGRTCSQWTKNNFKKMQVQLMLSKSSDNGLSNNIKTITAKLNERSKTVRFDVPYGATGPLVLSVYSVLTDHRCEASIYGALTPTQKAACNAGTAYFDIPTNTGLANPTECVSFEIQFATDYTYDLP